MLSVYPACFFKEDSGYSVIFPDLNYLATCGCTLDEALSMAIDCLAGYLYGFLRNNQPFPLAAHIDSINLNELAQELDIDPADSFVNMVTVDVKEYAKIHFEKSVKKTLSIPAWLNEAAIAQNINFSQVLQEALKAKLNII